MEQNEQRLRNSTRPNGGRPYRCATGMAVPKTGKLKGRSSVGPVYDPDEARAVSFAQVMEVCNYVASAALLFALFAPLALLLALPFFLVALPPPPPRSSGWGGWYSRGS